MLMLFTRGISRLGAVACAVIILTAAWAEDTPAPAWSADFETGQPGDWQAYGAGCALEIISEATRAGGFALRARFDDTSDAPWANKGMRVALPPGLTWDRFRYLVLHCHLDRSANAVGYLLHDRAGNWWRAQAERPPAGRWTPLAVRAGVFGFAWNDDPNMPPGTRDSEITELFLFVNTEGVNTGARYVFTVDDVSFCSVLPEGLEAPEPEAPEPPHALPPEEGEPFPLQWRVGNMDPRGYLTVNGEPVFPLGLYSCLGIDQASGAHPESHYDGPVTDEKVRFWLQSIKDAGFNLLQTYTMQFYGAELAPGVTGVWRPEDLRADATPQSLREGTARLLDLCRDHGLMLMAGSSPPYCAAALPTDPAARADALAAWKERVRANVLAWKDHPALLAWYLLDEPSSVSFPVADLTEQYRFLKELDSEHPLLIASCAATDVQYARAVDIFAPDPYPIETGVPLRELPARIRPLRALASGTPPMPQTWAVIQIGQWVEGRRLPGEAEMRLLALTALSQGVTGLLFYEFRNYADTHPDNWRSVGRVVRSLQTVIPALLTPGEVLEGLRVSDRRVYAYAKRVGEGPAATVWVIAANPSQNLAGEPMGLGTVSLSLDGAGLPDGAVAEALDEDASGAFDPGARRAVELQATAQGLVLTDEFDALGSHIYRIGAPVADL